MFTGIIAAVGTVQRIEQRSGDCRLTIAAVELGLDDVALGDSIACNGCCLTVVALEWDTFSVDVSNESLSLTTIGEWQQGSRINLEKAMRADGRFGGHLVSGHVDGVGAVVSRETDARSERFWLRAPEDLAKYIAQKGSICVDGTSLTVNKVRGCEFELNIIPHTLQETVIGDYRAETRVNLEVDLVARYLERLLAPAT